MLGKPRVVRLCVVALLAGEHVLLEDVPGVGKTLVGKALAKSIDGQFCRIQFTPDLLPSDIVGCSVFDTKTSEFFFSQGPIFANIVLADEINRTTPRTQSALLEAMSDGQVSVDGQTLPAAAAVHGHRHAEPVRVRRHLSAARKPARPLPAADQRRLSRPRRRVAGADQPSPAASRSISLTPVLDCQQVIALQDAVRQVAGRRIDPQLPARSDRSHAQ